MVSTKPLLQPELTQISQPVSIEDVLQYFCQFYGISLLGGWGRGIKSDQDIKAKSQGINQCYTQGEWLQVMGFTLSLGHDLWHFQ